MNPSTKPFVQILWHDAEDFKDATWSTEEELKEFASEPCEAVSYGYLVRKSRKYITIAADFIPPDTYGRIMKIPRKMIVKTEELSFPTAPPASETPVP